MLLGINMQTSFMHPPFGFALFYLRSVAPRGSYLDKVTGKRIAGVTTGQIYWGAVPFVIIQVIMVGARHRLPADGHALQAAADGIDLDTIEIELPPLGGGSQAAASTCRAAASTSTGRRPSALRRQALRQRHRPRRRRTRSAGATARRRHAPSGGLGLPPPDFATPPASP